MRMIKKRHVISLSLLTLLLTGCFQSALVFSPYLFEGEFVTQKTIINNSNYSRNSEYSSLSYLGFDGEIKYINNFRDLYSSSNIAQTFRNAPSTGEINALIIPVNFLDSDTSNNEKQLDYIKAACFGDNSCNEFESLASFYHKSSYGQLEINGYISDFYNFPLTSQQLVDAYTSSVGASRRVAISAVDWFFNTHTDLDYSKFDVDNDGYIDTLYILYNHPYNEDVNKDNGIFWAYVDHSYRGERADENIANNHEKAISSYAWISLSFLGEKVKPDARTILHESGHLYGLDDYYNASATGIYQPTGFADMMDANLGDHTGFSKMLLNWVTPYVVLDEGIITINDFAKYGDLILVPSSRGWNNTPYDEYLLLELYSPTGLNKHDAGTTYIYQSQGKEKKFSFLSQTGLKVYHVDARLGYFYFKNASSLITSFDDPNYLSKIEDYKKSNTRPYCIDFINSNDIPRGREDETDTLLHLLEKNGENTFKNGNASSNSTLFKKGDDFGLETFSNFQFNSGGSPLFDFEIVELDKNSIQIKFTKNIK